MKPLIVIPARYASQRYPGKPLVSLNGPDGAKTLIQRTWQAAQQIAGVPSVIATDDQRIADHARGFGADVVMTSAAARNGTERCAEVAALMPEHDLIVNLQGDAPLTPPGFITDLIAAMQPRKDVDIATPVLRCDGKMLRGLRADRRAGQVGGTTAVFGTDGQALYFSKEVIPFTDVDYGDDQPAPCYHHVGIYAYRRAALLAYSGWQVGPLETLEGLEQLRFLENSRAVLCVLVAANGHQFWELNNPSDVPIIEKMLSENARLAARFGANHG